MIMFMFQMVLTYPLWELLKMLQLEMCLSKFKLKLGFHTD